MLRVEPVPEIETLKDQEPVDFRIRQVVPGDDVGIDYTTELHMDLLPFGPMAKFGPQVIRETIYMTAINEGLLEVAVAEVNGRPSGFIAYTNDPERFYASLIRPHMFKVMRVMATALITRPDRLRHVPRAIKVTFSRNDLGENAANTRTEIISFGVRPEYLTTDFVRKTKIRVGIKLLQHAATYFRQHGFDSTRMIVDADNTRALLFYQSLGGELTACIYGGVPSFMVHMELDNLF